MFDVRVDFPTTLWFSVSIVKITYAPVHQAVLAPTASIPTGVRR